MYMYIYMYIYIYSHGYIYTPTVREVRPDLAAMIKGNLSYTHHHPHRITQTNGAWRAGVDYLSSNTI